MVEEKYTMRGEVVYYKIEIGVYMHSGHDKGVNRFKSVNPMMQRKRSTGRRKSLILGKPGNSQL